MTKTPTSYTLETTPTPHGLAVMLPALPIIIENSYAKLDCSKTTASGSGATLTVRWNVVFKSIFAISAPKKTYLYVKDDSGASSGWAEKGTWTIQAPPPAMFEITITEPVNGGIINAEP